MFRPEAEKLVDWILKESSNIDYGEINLKIIKHAGKIKFVEKTTAVKELHNG